MNAPADVRAVAAGAAALVATRWEMFVDGLAVSTRVGIHAREFERPQPLIADFRLAYYAVAGNEEFIDYERFCALVCDFLMGKPHTRLLETLAIELASLAFHTFALLDEMHITLHKPKIRRHTQRIGVSLHWTRADYMMRAAAAQ